MSNKLQPFSYEDIEISETISINGIPHLTRKAIGEFLEYLNPQVSIGNLVDRNQHILEFQYTSTVMSTDGKNYDTFVYDPIGFMLIAMRSDQPKALQMQIAIAKFVHHFAFNRPKLPFKEQVLASRLIASLTKEITETKNLFRRNALIRELQDTCLAAGKPMPDILEISQSVDQTDLFPRG